MKFGGGFLFVRAQHVSSLFKLSRRNGRSDRSAALTGTIQELAA